MTRATRLLFLMHFVGNALLLWLGYYWLGVGESTMIRLLWSALVAIVIMCGALYLHGTTLVYFSGEDRTSLSPALHTVLKHLGGLFVLAIVVLVVYGLLSAWQTYSPHPATMVASWFTLKGRKPVKPTTILAIMNAVLWVVRWLMLPIMLLPVAAEVASKGLHISPADAWTRARRWRYWIEVLALMIVGLWVPLKLILWVPKVGGFTMQMGSFMFRLVVAYLLFVGAWLLVERFSSGGSPRVSQPETVPVP
ncbi:MAG TPA: hypothetical protein VKU01_11040 [Bryobacteraceae bacterium]|nr:hypothetical protein [Bryobacteraceae bacterium]